VALSDLSRDDADSVESAEMVAACVPPARWAEDAALSAEEIDPALVWFMDATLAPPVWWSNCAIETCDRANVSAITEVAMICFLIAVTPPE
jgi:hypothetical protein